MKLYIAILLIFPSIHSKLRVTASNNSKWNLKMNNREKRINVPVPYYFPLTKKISNKVSKKILLKKIISRILTKI